MREIITTLVREKKFFFLSLIYLLIVSMVMMIQNYIRYGSYAHYDPWPTLIYLGAGVMLFLFFVPFYFSVISLIQKKAHRYIWIWVSITLLITVLLFYICSSLLLYLLEYSKAFFIESFTRFFFGRAIIFHLAYLLFTAFYIVKKDKGESLSKSISGTMGRKKITIKADLAKWIEADDHYLKVHVHDGVIITRSTLEQMTKTLNPNFIRIHRKYLVNKQQVIGKEKDKRDEYLILSTGERIKIGRSYLPLDLEQ